MPWWARLAERLRTLRELLQPVRLPKLPGRSRSSGRALPARTNCFGDLSYAVRCPCLIVASRHHLTMLVLGTWRFRRVSFRVPGNNRDKAQSWHAPRKRMKIRGEWRRIVRLPARPAVKSPASPAARRGCARRAWCKADGNGRARCFRICRASRRCTSCCVPWQAV